jgi:hypothetical protein
MSGQIRENAHRCPPFYQSPVVKGQRKVPEVRTVLEQVWPWFRRYADDKLGDPDRGGHLADELGHGLSVPA